MNNEEKILTMLEALTETVGKQGEQLAALTEKVDALDKKVDRQGEQLQELDDRLVRVALIQENDIQPKIQALFESVGILKDKQKAAPTEERVDALEDDVDVLKDVVRHLRQDVDELKNAQ